MIEYTEKGDISQHLPIFYTITRSLKPAVMLEIGIRGGRSTRAFDQAIVDSKITCTHHCCDIDTECSKVIDALKGPKNIFHCMPSDKLAEKWNEDIDILFIDGFHEYSQVKRDFMNFEPYVRKNGIIFFHDTFPGKYKDVKSKCWTVYKILDDLKELKVEHVTLPYQNGITICRKI